MLMLPQVRSEQLAAEGRLVLGAGVSGAGRFHHYLGRPIYIVGGAGARITDADGNSYLDLNMANGAVQLGYGHPAVDEAVRAAVSAGIVTAVETPQHIELATLLTQIIPSAERVRFVNTGTEATLVAIRLARGFTGRSTILKFDGHFHGLHELAVFNNARPDGPSQPVAASAGVPDTFGKQLIILPWNDREALAATMAEHGDQIAAVICEPVWYNAGCVLPDPGFLALLRDQTRAHGAVLIFDEVLSGFKMALGGAQAWSGVTPDLTTLAKALSNGLPLAAIVGRAAIMEHLMPVGSVNQSGTTSGHILGLVAALATLRELGRPGVYERFYGMGEAFCGQLQQIFDRYELPVQVQGLGARFWFYAGRRAPVRTWAEALEVDQALFRAIVLGCLKRGVHLHVYGGNGLGHAGFSLAHSDDDLALALAAFEATAADIAVRRSGM